MKMSNGSKIRRTIKMTKYISILLILCVSCKQANNNSDSKTDTIHSSLEATTDLDKKIDYDAIWLESSSKIESDLSANFEEIAKNFEEIIPNGFSIISSSTGDANLDGLTDTILIIKKDDDSYDFGTLILLLKQKDESYTVAVENNDILRGDSNTVKIDNGRIFIFEQYNAGVDISFFEFEKTKEKWILIEKFSSGLAGDGEVTKAEEPTTLGQ